MNCLPAAARLLLPVLLFFAWPVAGAEFSSQSAHARGTNRSVQLPRPTPDPLEPWNRGVWAFNERLLKVVIKPTSRLYRFVVRRPLRKGIANFGRNVTYPGRLMNNLLQARWSGAQDETHRFFCNTFAGAAGFLDVASLWRIPKSDADFGQTLGVWGWSPQVYVMWPVFGPSNERDTVGLGVDSAANPLSYVTPYSITERNPLTYLSPYTYFSYLVIYNNLAETVDGQVRMIDSQPDPYALLHHAWTYVRATDKPDLTSLGPPDAGSLETLQSALITARNPRFAEYGRTRTVRIPATNRKLEFTCWLQPRRAPLIYIVPGLGSHRLTGNALVLAELVYSNGFSAVTISSPYHPEFMEAAATASLPGYTPVDVRDLQKAIEAIDGQLSESDPGRFGSRGLIGYSMGGFQSLVLAATSVSNNSPLKIEKCVAIATPVRLTYGVAQLDEFYHAPLGWPDGDRERLLENTFLKLVASASGQLGPDSPIQWSAVESKFLVGLAFRFILRDLIYDTQVRTNQGVLKHPPRKWRRARVYDEIMDISFGEYLSSFVVPHYLEQGIDLRASEALEAVGNLRAHQEALGNFPGASVIINENDFLLAEEDRAWLRQTFAGRLTTFPRGGHLGNLGHPELHAAVLRALEGLKDPDRATQ